MRLRVPAYAPPAGMEDARPVEVELELTIEQLEGYRRWLHAEPLTPEARLTSEVEWTATDIRAAVWWALGRPVPDPLDIGFIGTEIKLLEEL